jgi:hypothetical protein
MTGTVHAFTPAPEKNPTISKYMDSDILFVDFDYPTVILSSVLFSTFKISKSELLLKP